MGRTNVAEVEDFLTKEEAAQILEKNWRTIYRYIEKGWLETARRGTTIGTTRQSVYELKQELESEANPYLVKIGRLESRVLMLESRMSAVMRILNMRNQPLTLTDPEAKSLYDMADYASKNGWSPHNEETLIDVFLRMQDKNIEQFERVSGDEHPWRPFLLLAGTMRHALFTRGLQADVELAAGNMTVLAQLWCKKKGETTKAFDILVARDATPLKKLMNRLEREKLKLNVPGEA
jgi:hypothetical protein